MLRCYPLIWGGILVLFKALCQNCVFYKGSINRLDWMWAVLILLSKRNQACKEGFFQQCLVGNFTLGSLPVLHEMLQGFSMCQCVVSCLFKCHMCTLCRCISWSGENHVIYVMYWALGFRRMSKVSKCLRLQCSTWLNGALSCSRLLVSMSLSLWDHPWTFWRVVIHLVGQLQRAVPCFDWLLLWPSIFTKQDLHSTDSSIRVILLYFTYTCVCRLTSIVTHKQRMTTAPNIIPTVTSQSGRSNRLRLLLIPNLVTWRGMVGKKKPGS